MNKGMVYGVGLGPGSQDLMSVRSDKIIREARYVAYFRKKNVRGKARTIVDEMLPENVVEIPMVYPVTTEIPFNSPEYTKLLSSFYEECSESLIKLCEEGKDVVVLCEGDPFFYGSFMHLYTRFSDRGAEIEVIPGITGMSAGWTATGLPITWGDDVLSVLMGTLPEDKLVQQMKVADALVVMKIGSNLDKVKNALELAGKLDNAYYVEYAAMDKESIKMLTEVTKAPYFSMVVVHGNGRRP